MKINVSPVFTKNYKAHSRIVVNEGSSRSTKTISILQNIMAYNMADKKAISRIYRKHLPWAKNSVMEDFFWLCENHFNLPSKESRAFNKSSLLYTFPNGSKLSFRATKDVSRLHGEKQTLAYINEAIESEEDAFKQILLRTTDKIYLDYNPVTDQSWIYDTVLGRNDCTFIKSTYKDNPFLERHIIDEIEKLAPTDINKRMGTANEALWKIYGLGERYSLTSYFKDMKSIPSMPSTSGFAWIDPSFEGGDYTALCMVKPYFNGIAIKGRVYKMAWYDLFDEFKKEIYENGITKLGFETNSLGDLPVRELRDILQGIEVQGMKTTTNKHKKIATASGYSNALYLSDDSDRLFKSQVKNYKYKVGPDDAPDSIASCLLWMGLIHV